MSKSCRDMSQFGRLLRLYRQMAPQKLPNLGEPGLAEIRVSENAK
jgi:hypothetical protein